MAEVVFVLGETGTGKSYSIRNMDPAKTFLVKCVNKRLPFQKSSQLFNKDTQKNTVTTSEAGKIIEVLNLIAAKRPDIQDVVIDDFQYMMSFEYLTKIDQDVWDTFKSIGSNVFQVLNVARAMPEHMNIFFLCHSDTTTTEFGSRTKIKTVGKMVDEKITPEGLASIVLYTRVVHDASAETNTAVFVTQNDGRNTAKSPPGMFKTREIPNDLAEVSKAIRAYY